MRGGVAYMHYGFRNTELLILLTNSVEQSPEKLPFLGYSRYFPHFMEPERSSPHSQAHTTCPCQGNTSNSNYQKKR
jgi:hypothetical protein